MIENDIKIDTCHKTRLGVDIKLRDCYFLLEENKENKKKIKVFLREEDMDFFCERPFAPYTFLDIYLNCLKNYGICGKMTQSQIHENLSLADPYFYIASSSLEELLNRLEKEKFMHNINKNKFDINFSDYLTNCLRKEEIFKPVATNKRVAGTFCKIIEELHGLPNCPAEMKENLETIKISYEKLNGKKLQGGENFSRISINASPRAESKVIDSLELC